MVGWYTGFDPSPHGSTGAISTAQSRVVFLRSPRIWPASDARTSTIHLTRSQSLVWFVPTEEYHRETQVEKQTKEVKDHKEKAEKDIEEIATTTKGRIEESKTQAVAEMQKKGATMVQKVTTDISAWVQTAEGDLQKKAANIRTFH